MDLRKLLNLAGAKKLYDDLRVRLNQKYTKPATGIPASDIADGVIPDMSGKADKVSNATSGNFAGLDANGNLTDSGKKAADFAAQSDLSGLYRKPATGIPSTDMASAVQTSLGKADTAYQKPSGGIPGTDLAEGVIPDPEGIIDDTAGSGSTNKVWSADKSASEVSTLNNAISQKYEKPSTGIPATDLASGVIPSVPVQDVQVNGTSVVTSGTANIPSATSQVMGVTKIGSGLMVSNNTTMINTAPDNVIKAGSNVYAPVTPSNQDKSVFYGLAKAAGDSTQASSSAPVGEYTQTAQDKILAMIGAEKVVTLTGTTQTITAVKNTRYICGTVATLSITPPVSGCIDVVFTSGSTPTVLTVPNTVKFPAWFDPTSLEASVTYEINILDGVYGAVMKWA